MIDKFGIRLLEANTLDAFVYARASLFELMTSLVNVSLKLKK